MQQLILYIIIQSLVLGAVLFSTRKKENNLLGALFLTIFLQHLVLYNQHEWRPKYPELFLFLYALTLCRIPLMFFYIKLLLKKSVEKIHFTLWLFPLTCCFLAIYFYLFKLYNPSANSLNFILNLSGTIISCIFLFYAGIQLSELQLYSALHQPLSPHLKITISVCCWFLYFLIFRALTSLLTRLFCIFYPDSSKFESWFTLMITAVLCLLLILFVYVALRKPEIFNEPSAAGFIEQKIIHAVNMGQGKALKPPTPEQEMILQKLTDFVEGDSLYIDPDIDQKKVASLLNIPVHKLSKAMVDCWGKSFSAYINELRVEKVKELLRSEQYKHYTIAAISREAGFNNESLFYRVFKKHTGQTPVLFQRNTP